MQNSGFRMPMFASANQQVDSVDIQDIFADYFQEDDGAINQFNLFPNNNQQGLPTGQGIKTAWHSGVLPAMGNNNNNMGNNSLGNGVNLSNVSNNEPAMKRIRGGEENLYLPQAGDQGGVVGNVGNVGAQQFSASSTAAPGAGDLSGRLGFQMSGGAGMASMVGVGEMGGGMQQTFNNVGNNLMGGQGLVVNGGGGANTMMQMFPTMQQFSLPFQLVDKASIEDQMTAERRMRNREHAKRSRVRKKFMLESLQQQVRGLQEENSALRMLVQKHIPQQALQIIDECCSKNPLFGGVDLGLEDEDKEGGGGGGDGSAKKQTELLKTDFSLIESLTSGQQNFVLSDPRLPDNPIVFASPGFYELTGYTREQVLGRNCRFLQGTGTDPKAVDVIRTAIANGTDATTCFINYKADGTPFWNQLFVAALRDGDNCIVNYVGVQTMIEPNAGASALEDKVNAAHPLHIGMDDEDNDKDLDA